MTLYFSCLVVVTVTTSLQCGKLHAQDGLCVYVRKTSNQTEGKHL